MLSLQSCASFRSSRCGSEGHTRLSLVFFLLTARAIIIPVRLWQRARARVAAVGVERRQQGIGIDMSRFLLALRARLDPLDTD
jgi:hypothetical protein